MDHDETAHQEWAPRPGESSLDFWERFYRSREEVFSGQVNPVLAQVAADLEPGTALDLGCGEGGDTVWLAERGWRVTAVDVSPTALERTVARAEKAGVGERVTVEQHDLLASLPGGQFDLVSAQYLQSPVEIDRDRVLRAARDLVAPGGLLLVVDHGSAPSWSWVDPSQHRFPSPAELLESLALPEEGWQCEQVASCTREATGPQGEHGTVVDTVVAVRRLP